MAVFQYNGNGNAFSSGLLSERAIFSYNEFSRVDYLEITYGSITDSITDSEDYGYITGDIITYDQIEDFGTITINRTQTPYGRLHIFQEFSDDSLSRVSVGGVRFALYGRANYEVIFNPLNRAFEIEGSAETPLTKSYDGSGYFTTFVGSADSVGVNPPESAILFKFQGKAETEVIFNERSRILYFDSATEVSKTNNYNETSVVTFSSVDYGFISEIESLYENYGLISEDEDFANWEREDFGFITENETRIPYGKTEFISYTTESITNPHVGSGITKIYGKGLGRPTPRQLGDGYAKFSGTSVDRFRLRYFGSGSAFTFVSSSESTKVQTEQEGSVRFVGEAVERYTKGNYDGQSNKDIAIRGVAACEVIFNPIDRFARFLNLEINSRTFSYNESSVVSLEGIDYGFINESPTLFGDYGNITDIAYYPWEEDDYGFITDNVTNLPFGKFTFISGTTESNTENYVGSGSIRITGKAKLFVLPKHNGSGFARFIGSAIEKNTEDYVGSGSIFTFVSSTESETNAEESKELFQFIGTATEKFGKGLYTGSGSIFAFSSTTEATSTQEQSEELFRFTGAAIEKNTESYVGSGSLFSLFGSVERVAYSYNESSAVRIDSIDYGFITETPTYFDDYDLVDGNPYYPWQRDNYGFITDNATILPFGKTSFVSGTTESNTENYVGSGSIFVRGEAKLFVLPKHNGSGFARFIGSAIEKNTEDYVGSGSIFTFVSSTESETNTESSRELFQFSGTATEKFGKGLYTGSGSIFAFSSTTEATSTQEQSEELFKFSGTLVEKHTESYVGSGSLFEFIVSEERVTYSYNESSAVRIDSIDYGFITETPTYFDDYDEITGTSYYPWQREDYGFITDNATILPYGKTTFISGTTESNTENYVGSGSIFVNAEAAIFVSNKHTGFGYLYFSGSAIEKNTEDYVGSGSIFTFVSATESETNTETSKELFQFSGTATEKFGKGLYTGSGSIFAFSSTTETESNAQETKGLFKFYGSATDSNTESYVGRGSLFSFSTKKERVTYSYNQSSVYTFESLDYGFISEVPTLFGDYGNITENPFVPYPENSDYGFITDNQTRLPYGSLNISGTLESIKIRLNYSGSGSINIDGNAEYAYTPEETGTGLFNITSNPIIKISLLHVGSGSIFTFVSATESETNTETSKELFQFSGTATEKFGKGLYTGSGSIFTFASTTEAEANIQETKGLFKFYGSSIEKNTESYVGSGSLFSLVGGDESSTPAPEPGSGTINIFGTATERNTESYFGTGTLFGFSSTVDSTLVSESGTNLFRISGSATESTTPATEIGSGSIFTFVSATEAFIINPPDQTTLFTLSGSAVERNTESYFGTGTLFGFSSTTEAYSFVPKVEGLFRISGSATESTTPATEIGSGSIFTFVSATEAFIINPPDQTTLFTFSGSAVERNTESYNGSGSIFAFSSTTDTALLAVSAEGLIKFYGSAHTTRSPSFVGSGVAFAFLEGVQYDSAGKVRYVSGQEATTRIPPTFGTLFSVSGEVRIFFEYRETGTGSVLLRGAGFAQPSARHIGEGKFSIGGSVQDSTKVDRSGSGSIFGFVSSTESSIVNPPESTELFRISGASVERYTGASDTIAEIAISGSARIRRVPSVISVGKLTVSGSGEESYIRAPYSGFCRISTVGASSDYRTVINPPEVGTIVLLRGNATTRGIINYEGSGSIFTFVSTAETRLNAERSEELFRISGSAVEKNTETYIGIGNLFEFSLRPVVDSNGKVSYVAADESTTSIPPTEIAETRFFGSADVRKTPSYVGSGSIFAFVSKSESFGANPPESTELFKLSGSAIEKNTESYVGSGSIFAFVSSTESISARPQESTSLFRISGGASKFSITRGQYIGSGSIFTFISSTESTLVSPPATGIFDISGSVDDSVSRAEIGSGSIFAFSSTTRSSVKSYTSTELFRITGSAFESFATTGYEGYIHSVLSGSSVDRKNDYVAPKPVRLYII